MANVPWLLHHEDDGLPGHGGERPPAETDRQQGCPGAKGGGQGGGKKRRGGGGKAKKKGAVSRPDGPLPDFREADDPAAGAAFARALGIRDVDYGNANAFTVNNVNRAIWELRRAGAEPVPGIRVNGEWFGERFGEDALRSPRCTTTTPAPSW